MNMRSVPVPPPVGSSQPLRVPIWILAVVTFSGTLAMHIFIPALPIAGADLGAGIAEMQLTVSLYIVGLAIGQLVYGPLSDRFGRRPVLMGGLVLYTLSCAASILAPNAEILIVTRLFQAFGGCAGLVIARAIVRDICDPVDTVRQLAVMNLMVVIGPGAAPIVGGLIATSFGWRAVFVALSAMGAAILYLTWRSIPETRADPGDTRFSTFGRNYARLLTSPRFLALSIGGGCATTSMYAFVASAPFIFGNDLGRPAHEAGIYLAILISGVWIGSMMAKWVIGRMTMAKVLVLGNLISVAAAFVFLAAVLGGFLSVWLVVAAMTVMTMGIGLASPASMTEAFSVNPAVVGSASGLYGSAQMAVGAICTALASLGSHPALSAALVLAGAGVVAQLCFWFALSRSGS